MRKAFLFFSLIGFMTSSCDTMLVAEGIVLNKVTHNPIADVAITMKEGITNDPGVPSTYSGPAGQFRVSKTSGMQHNVHITFSHKGYITRELEFPGVSHGDTVYLEPNY